MQKTPPKITAQYLENAAFHYLQRYASSRANLERVMWRKINRSLAHWGGEREDVLPLLNACIEKAIRLGYIDDQNFAAQKVRSLNRAGKGTRLIAQTLRAKGIGETDLENALAELADDIPEPDFEAALKLARKRKLGPFRQKDAADFRQKDMAALARAGFGFDIISRVMGTEPDDPVLDF